LSLKTKVHGLPSVWASKLMTMVCEWFDLKTTRTVFAGLASKLVVTVSSGLVSKSAATIQNLFQSKFSRIIPNFAEFYRILRNSTGSLGSDFFVMIEFSNAGQDHKFF
jgi:hypothetical protein